VSAAASSSADGRASGASATHASTSACHRSGQPPHDGQRGRVEPRQEARIEVGRQRKHDGDRHGRKDERGHAAEQLQLAASHRRQSRQFATWRSIEIIFMFLFILLIY